MKVFFLITQHSNLFLEPPSIEKWIFLLKETTETTTKYTHYPLCYTARIIEIWLMQNG